MINVALWLKKEWTDVPACPDTRGNTEKRAREMITADILIDMVGLVCEYYFKRKSREVKLEPQGQEKREKGANLVHQWKVTWVEEHPHAGTRFYMAKRQ